MWQPQCLRCDSTGASLPSSPSRRAWRHALPAGPPPAGDAHSPSDSVPPGPTIPPAILPLLAVEAGVEGMLRAGEPITVLARARALEERVATDAAGRYHATLRAGSAEPFKGCVSVLVEPPTRLALRAGAGRAIVDFSTGEAAAGTNIDVALDPATRTP